MRGRGKTGKDERRRAKDSPSTLLPEIKWVLYVSVSVRWKLCVWKRRRVRQFSEGVVRWMQALKRRFNLLFLSRRGRGGDVSRRLNGACRTVESAGGGETNGGTNGSLGEGSGDPTEG
jgi:hypothetical protein